MFRFDQLKVFEDALLKKKLTPRFLQLMSLCGLSYSILVTSLIFLTTFLEVLPVIYPDKSEYRLQAFFLIYMLFNILVNLLLVSVNRSFYDGAKMDHLPDSSWVRCTECNQSAPPRSHHCPLCRHCILQRDHHCFFTASCIGFQNQRYFIIFTFYCGVGSAYCLYLLYRYLNTVHISYSFVQYLLPIATLEWIFQYMGSFEFYCLLIGWLCFVSAMGSLSIFAWQFFLATVGVTTFEFQSGKFGHRHSIRYNLRSVFGSWWPLNFIAPMLCFKTPGDGTTRNSLKYI